MEEFTKEADKSGSTKPAKVLLVNEVTELMKFLLVQLPDKNRNNIKSLLKHKQVLVDDKIITQFNHVLNPGQKVHFVSDRIATAKVFRGINIVFEDQYLIVIDKHAGMLSVAKDNEQNETAYSILSRHVKTFNPNNKIFVVHRLDRDTSGLMMFAKSQQIQKLLQEDWNNDIKERTYVALTHGQVEKDEDIITSYLYESKALIVYSSQNPEKGDKAITHYRVIRSNAQYSLLIVNLETGKKNQIRVHMQDIGHSIVGDKKYGSTGNPIGRLGLHACVLAFKHPITQELLSFETKIPKKFLMLF
jgi:23S rRNA pseudouridine1911/1915/1917 synthase